MSADPNTPIVFEQNGAVFASSRDVAAFFEKRHDHILRDIDDLVSKVADLTIPKIGEPPYFVESKAPWVVRPDKDDRSAAASALSDRGGPAMTRNASRNNPLTPRRKELHRPRRGRGRGSKVAPDLTSLGWLSPRAAQSPTGSRGEACQ